MVSSAVTALVLALGISPVLATPVFPILEARQDFGSCRNQSCEIATIAGSTGATVYTYPSYPTGDTQDGDCCIVRYFPAAKDAIYSQRPGLQSYCAAHGGDAPADSDPLGVNSVTIQPSSKRGLFDNKAAAATTCKPNILIFVKGTLEPGDTGITIGPSLKSNLDSSKWDVRGVSYDNSFANDYCLGLPGGINARQALAQAISDCPNARIALSGYSQGAMVVRNALARAPAANVAKVSNVVTFGDPFVGAKIGQYTGPVHVFCMQNDGVCDGQINIGLAHLSYGSDVSAAVAILNAGAA